MSTIHIITPVKNSIDLSLKTIRAVMNSSLRIPVDYTVYNDFSTPENTAALQKASIELGFRLINLSDMTTHPSPNYLLVLQHAQSEAIRDDAHLIIVESDVVVEPHTLQALADGANEQPACGIAASVTVDENGEINYPYAFARGIGDNIVKTDKHCSFCCSLLTNKFLRAFDFNSLNPEKNWFDVTISHEARRLGYYNYLFGTLPVLHQPHSSRPWKQLKYSNPLKYYWLKYTKGLDKI